MAKQIFFFVWGCFCNCRELALKKVPKYPSKKKENIIMFVNHLQGTRMESRIKDAMGTLGISEGRKDLPPDGFVIKRLVNGKLIGEGEVYGGPKSVSSVRKFLEGRDLEKKIA
jgi:hypothetical protein